MNRLFRLSFVLLILAKEDKKVEIISSPEAKDKFDKERIIDSLQVAGKLSTQDAIVSVEGEEDTRYNKSYHCNKCNFELQKLKMLKY